MFEDLKKTERSGSRPGRGGMLGPLGLLQVRDPKVRIGCLVVGLVIILSAMFGLGKWARSKEAREDTLAPTPKVSELAEVEGLSGVPAFDMERADRIADSGPDARRRWEPDAIPYLLRQARNVPAVHAYRRNLLPVTEGSAAQIGKDSRPWRFKYVRFKGPLEYLREEDYEEVYGETEPEIGRVHRGRVRVAGTEPPVRVVFVTPMPPLWTDLNDPSPRSEYKLITDGWVRVRGIFVKNYVDADGKEALLVVATDVERAYEPVPVESLDDIPFQIIDDDPSLLGRSEHGRVVLAKEYPRPLFRLVKYAARLAGPEGAAAREEEGLEPIRFESDKEWEKVLANPAQYRAKYIGGLGAIALEPSYYGPSNITPNDAGVEECINGWIITDQYKLIQFIAPASLAAEWSKRDRVAYEGFFYKAKLYPAQTGIDHVAPVLVLTVLRSVPPRKPDYMTQILIAVGFIVGVAALFFLVVREDRTKESYRAQQRKRRERALESS